MAFLWSDAMDELPRWASGDHVSCLSSGSSNNYYDTAVSLDAFLIGKNVSHQVLQEAKGDSPTPVVLLVDERVRLNSIGHIAKCPMKFNTG